MADIYNFDTLFDDGVSLESEVRALRRELNRLKTDNKNLKEKVSDLTRKVYFHEGVGQALPYVIIGSMLGTVFLAVVITHDMVGM